MAHAQKPDFVFRRNGQVHLNSAGGASVQSTTGSRGVRISSSNAGYTMFRGSMKSFGYPLHSPHSPSLPLPCVTVCHHISTGVYHVCSCVTFAFIIILMRFSLLLYSQFKFILNTHAKSLFPVWQTQWACIKAGGTELWILVMVWRRKKKDLDLCNVSSFVVFCFCGASGPVSPHSRGFTITLRHTTLRGTPVDEWSARQRPLPDNTQQSQETDIYLPGGIQTHSPSKRVAADRLLGPRCQ